MLTRLRTMLVRGELDLPLPGGGQTGRRWTKLACWGRSDLELARLAEGHTDALAILAEAGVAASPGELYGVWAARPGGRGPALVEAGGVPAVEGRAWFCSGADLLDRALLVVGGEPVGHPSLVEVSLAHPGVQPDPGSWRADAMAGSDTWAVDFAGVPVARAVGAPGWYTERRGFTVGAGGVAAVWWGAQDGLLSRAVDHRRDSADPHTRAHLGELYAVLMACRALLDRTADEVDAGPGRDHARAISALRCAVEHAGREVVDRLPRALGPTALSTDATLAPQLANLQMFLRQHHGERDYAELATALCEQAAQ